MLDIRQFLVTGSFLLLCLCVLIISLTIEVDRSLFDEEGKNRDVKEGRESLFKGVSYYVYKNNAKSFHLDASELILDKTGKTSFTNPLGSYYTKSNRVLHYKALNGIWWQQQDKLHFNRQVQVNTEDTWVDSDKMTFFLQEDRIEGEGNVVTKTISPKNGDQILVSSNKMIAWISRQESYYSGKVRGRLTRRKVYEQGMEFDSDNLRLFGEQLKAEMEGNVSIKKRGFKAQSHRGEIFLKNYNKKLKYFVLYDDVKVVEKVKLEQRWITRKAFAEKLEGIMSKDKYVLTGYPRVFQEGDIIKGYRIILRENNEVLEVDDSNINFILRQK